MSTTASGAPVTAAVIAWALREDGRELEELAAGLQVPTERLSAWAAGEVLPSKGELTNLARKLGRPRALFFMPEAPVSFSLPDGFRSAPGEAGVIIPADVRRQIRRSRRIQQAVGWARATESDVEVPTASLDEPATEAAARLRAWLQVPVDEQGSWSDEYASLRAWRAAFDELGVLTFVIALGRDQVRGFSAWDEKAPLIVANRSSMKPAARNFTLMHELGHLALRQDATCLTLSGDDHDPRVERWCEVFGGAVLMPAEAIRAVVSAEDTAAAGRADVNTVRLVMRRFRVSARAAAIRLVDLRLAQEPLKAEVTGEFAPSKQARKDGRMASAPRPVERVRQYGPETIRTVLSALPTQDALDVLRITLPDAREMAVEVPGVPDL